MFCNDSKEGGRHRASIAQLLPTCAASECPAAARRPLLDSPPWVPVGDSGPPRAPPPLLPPGASRTGVVVSATCQRVVQEEGSAWAPSRQSMMAVACGLNEWLLCVPPVPPGW